MKKHNFKKFISVILIFTSISLFAQEKTTIPKKDSESFFWKGGDEKFYNVKFGCGDCEELDNEILEKAVMNVMVKSKYKLKNKNSFIPKELLILKNGEKFTASSKYLGTNSYGAEGESESFFEFNDKGEVTFLFNT